MKAGVIRMALFGVGFASLLSPATGSAAGGAGVTPLTGVSKELVSPWRQTKTNEWVRYHYPMVRPPVYKDVRLVQPQEVVSGWFETNNTPPLVAAKTTTKAPPPEPPNLDDPKSLRAYVLKNGLVVPEVFAPNTSCAGGA